LKRDEEFRLAVAGLLGYREILDELRRLREDFNKLYQKSLEHDKRFEVIEEELKKLREDFNKLYQKGLEHDKRFEILEKKLLEHDKRFEAIERKLLEHDKRFEVIEKRLEEHDKRLEAIEKKLEEHDRKFEAVERKLLEHDKRFEAIEAKLVEHDKKFEELRIEIRDLKLVVDENRKRLSRLELAVGALTESFYAKLVLDQIAAIARGEGDEVVRWERNARIDEEDIDLLIETRRKVYVVEIKVKPKHRHVGALLAKTDIVRRHFPGKEVVPVLSGSLIGKEIAEYARQHGVVVLGW